MTANAWKPRPLTDDNGNVIPLRRRMRLRLQNGRMPEHCWIVMGSKGQPLWPHAYPTVVLETGVQVAAHRWSWVAANQRPIPLGHVVHHRCYVKRCVNPRHLVVCTIGENSAIGNREVRELAA